LDLVPIEPVMWLPPDYDPKQGHNHRQTVVWAAPAGTTTPLHYDIQYNFFTQIYGRKRFILMPPEAWERVYLYPYLHPGSQQAQIDLNRPDSTRFPDYQDIHAFEAVLEPGDVLFVPPLWFHHVIALEPSVSVSVWTHYRASALFAKATKEFPPPIRLTWSKAKQAAALRLWLESLTENLDMANGNIASFVDWAILQTRYRHIGKDAAKRAANEPRFCLNEALEDEVLNQERQVFTSQLNELVGLFREMLEIGGMPRRDTWLANYMELSVHAVVGEHVKYFLHDLVYC